MFCAFCVPLQTQICYVRNVKSDGNQARRVFGFAITTSDTSLRNHPVIRHGLNLTPMPASL
jgi:hypothetical protein